MEAHLALYCKGPVPDDIRRRWLIEVVKRGEKKLQKHYLKLLYVVEFSLWLLIIHTSRKLLQPGYMPPHKDALSALNGWTSPRGDSLYNFIITTPNHYEYLYALANYSGEHQTGNFIANKISDIIKKI
ncbi:35714_t:CDS:2, partial [Gigaspora margarita]